MWRDSLPRIIFKFNTEIFNKSRYEGDSKKNEKKVKLTSHITPHHIHFEYLNNTTFGWELRNLSWSFISRLLQVEQSIFSQKKVSTLFFSLCWGLTIHRQTFEHSIHSFYTWKFYLFWWCSLDNFFLLLFVLFRPQLFHFFSFYKIFLQKWEEIQGKDIMTKITIYTILYNEELRVEKRWEFEALNKLLRFFSFHF